MVGEGHEDSGAPERLHEPYAAYLRAILIPDDVAAFELAESLLEEGMSYPELCLTVIQPAMHEVGRLWQRSELSVAQEHMATAITQTVMARVFVGSSSTRKDGSIVVCSTPGELHSLGARMVADFAQLDGWKAFFVGPAVPTQDLLSLVKDKKPKALALSTSVPINIPQAKACVESVKQVAPDVWVMVGGRAYAGKPENAAAIGADVFAADAGDFLEKLRVRFS